MENINVEIRQLRAFLAVARHGSFTRAAEEIYLTQPGLSLMIQQLEDQLGIRLFNRSTRRVELTEAGNYLAFAADRIINDVDEVVRGIIDLANYKRGRVTIGILPSLSVIIPQIIVRFNDIYPEIKVTIHDEFAEPLVKMVETGAVDFSIGLRLQFEKDLVFRKIISDSLMVLMPSGHPLEKNSEVSWGDLTGTDLIAMSRGTSVRHLIDQTFSRLGRSLNPAYEVTYMSTAICMVRAKLGITVLTSLALSDLMMPDISVRPLNNPLVKREIGIVSKRNHTFSPAAQAFLDLLKNDAKVKEIIRNCYK